MPTTELATVQSHAAVVGITALVVIACIFLHYESLSFLTVVLKRMHTRARPRILVLIFAILLTHVLEIGFSDSLTTFSFPRKGTER